MIALTVLQQLLFVTGDVEYVADKLTAALETAANEWGCDISVTAPANRCGDDIETTAYLTVAELLAGLHSRTLRCQQNSMSRRSLEH